MASSYRPPVIHDVFLSFRGKDTRNGFTSHLNAALCRKEIKTFIDDGLRRGDPISSSLVEAIEGSKISIIIFSENCASSKWCLQELVKILECKEKYGQIMIPIFYHVDPSDVRKQTGSIGDALAKHKVRFQTEEQMLQRRRWRNALTEAANISGFDSNIVGLESTLIEKIITIVLKRLNKTCSSYKNLVGVAMKVQTIISLLSNGPSNVCKVGIWGMGGIGKTTIANAIFNEISSQFEGSHFVQNIREESEKHGLTQLQEKLLSTLLEDEHPNIRHAFTIERLKRKKVLIVFDDVTHINQINELIGDLENLSARSQIIITTRDKQVLVSCNVDHARIYQVEGLYGDESFQLFSQCAFKQNYPIDKDYMELSRRVIRHAKGVPLALKVLGFFLLDRAKHEWESTLEKLKNCPHQDIQAVLKISYDGLDMEDKNLFLDIACFLNGWDNCLVCKFSSSIGLRVLVDKALITISFGKIEVHDLLQEMGKEIVRQQSFNKLGERSRLWLDNDVYDVLNKNKGTDKIQGLRFNMSEIREIQLNPHAFSELDYLRLLIVDKSECEGKYNNVHGFEELESDFTELRCLCWDFYPFKSLPLKFYPRNLLVLMMRRSNLKQLWTGIKDVCVTKNVINLSRSKRLLRLPDLSEAQILECLILEDCTSLREIIPPTRNLNNLVELDLRNCKNLTSLPIGLQSKSLKNVFLSGCSNLETAPRISCNMEQLCLDGTAIKKLSSSIESPSRLVELNLHDCLRLETLPSSVCNLESLQQLNLSGLLKVKFVLGIPRNIKELNLEGTAIKELPSSIENASRLERLSLKGCASLESLPTSIVNLSKLKLLDIGYCERLQSLPKLPSNIEELRAENCKRLKAISGLKNLSQRHCGRTLSFPNCVSLNWNAVRNILHDAALDLYSDEFEVFKYEKEVGKPQGVMCFPGSEIPEWFNIQSSGSVIELPKGSFNHKKFLGFVLCVIVEGQDSGEFFNVEYEFRVKCRNEYMTFDKKLLSIEPTNIKSDHVLLGYNCNTCELFEFSSDIEAIITFKPGLYTTLSVEKVIKKCGVRLVFTQEFNEPMKRSKCSIVDEEEVQDEAYSVSRRFRSSNFFKGESSSRCFMIDEEHEEAYSKGCKSSNFFKGESSSSSGWHQPQHEKEVEEFNPSTNDFNPSTNEYSRFSSDLNEILNIKIGSKRDVRGTTMLSPADN